MMGLRVVFYVPAVHTQSCLVLRDWVLRRDRGEVLIISTPKLQTGRRSALGQLVRILRQSGVGYLVQQARMTRAYLKSCEREERAGVPLANRRNIRPSDLAALPGVQHRSVRDINSDEALGIIREFKPDVSIAVFFNQIVRKNALKIPGELALNVHPSLLPAYRGISPVFRVLAHGEAEAGISVHKMTSKLDFGSIYAQARTAIDPNDSVFQLYRRLAALGGASLAECLDVLARGGKLDVIPEQGEPSQFGVVDRAALREFKGRNRLWFRVTDTD